MTPRSRRILVIVLLLLLALLALWFGRCSKSASVPPDAAATKAASPASAASATPQAVAGQPEERLTPATVQVPSRVAAGATFRASWHGPDNEGDYLAIVRPDASPAAFQYYQETKRGAVLEMTAPIETGEWEVRYIAAHSKTVLGRALIVVDPIAATLTAPEEVVLGAPLAVNWTGPDNAGDFVTIVVTGAADAVYGSYVETAKGSPARLVAPVQGSAAEIRYVAGQGRKVLARRKIVLITPETSLVAPADVIAGAMFSVTWQGPKNAGDYITVVPKGTAAGQYRNYTDTAKGSPLQLRAPADAGEAEIRYMTGTNVRVLARRPITVNAPTVTLHAAEEAVVGTAVTIHWTGPNNPGDYLTIVLKDIPDDQHGHYTQVTKGSPLAVTAPLKPGPAEIRYVSGQGTKVFARRAISITAAR